MATNSIRIRYRPLRLGWCIREGNWDDLHKVLRCAHTLWGGVYNPILSLGDPDDKEKYVDNPPMEPVLARLMNAIAPHSLVMLRLPATLATSACGSVK